jgi:chromosomal replication initiation ATPase DnaA
MVIDIHNPLSSKLTNIHNSIRNEVLTKFNLNDLHLKTSNEFIIDLSSSNFKGKYNYIHIGGVVGSGKSQIIKVISAYFQKKHSHDMFKMLAFIASVALLIGGSTIHSLIGL